VFKRTDGISTTDLVGRMLLCTKQHQLQPGQEPAGLHERAESFGNASLRYLTTSRKIVQFSNNSVPKPTDRIVYVDGSFDLFHIGHMRVLEEARKLGDYVICGIHEDAVVNQHKGSNFPIMNLNERVLGVLSCRYVDEVVMGVPFAVTEELIEKLGVHAVVAGKIRDVPTAADGDHPHGAAAGAQDPYEVPKRLGIYVEVISGCDLTADSMIQRIVDHRQAFLERQAKKVVKDKAMEAAKPDAYKNVAEVA
jgi:ethanolamine-phosphate cytidylyltransferase